jgi:hypothetical protein
MIFEVIYRARERERFVMEGQKGDIGGQMRPTRMVTCVSSRDLFIPVHNVSIAWR